METILTEKGSENIGKCIEEITSHLGYSNKTKLFEDIGGRKINEILLDDAVNRFCTKQRSVSFWKIKRSQKNKNDSLPESIKLAKCCNPFPGNEIIGTHDEEGNITIHKINCSTALAEISLKLNDVEVVWTSYKAISVLREFLIKGIYSPEVINKITNTVSKEISVKIKTFFYETKGDYFTLILKLYIKKEENSTDIYDKLSKLPFVTEIDVS